MALGTTSAKGLGTIYGVGVGPGAPDLITLRAINVLRAVDVIAIPRKDRFSKSVAWRIAQPNVGEIADQERLFLHFPMTKDPAITRPAWKVALEQVGERIEKGLDVAFITEGDPFVYSTFIYLMQEARARWANVDIQVVPAVSSISAVPAVTGVPLADGQERVAMIPASYRTDDLAEILEQFDTTVLFKTGSVMPQVVEQIEKANLLHKAVYVSRATMEGENIVRDVRSVRNDRCDYFSMVIVSKKDRSGALAGDSAVEDRHEVVSRGEQQE